MKKDGHMLYSIVGRGYENELKIYPSVNSQHIFPSNVNSCCAFHAKERKKKKEKQQ